MTWLHHIILSKKMLFLRPETGLEYSPSLSISSSERFVSPISMISPSLPPNHSSSYSIFERSLLVHWQTFSDALRIWAVSLVSTFPRCYQNGAHREMNSHCLLSLSPSTVQMPGCISAKSRVFLFGSRVDARFNGPNSARSNARFSLTVTEPVPRL